MRGGGLTIPKPLTFEPPTLAPSTWAPPAAFDRWLTGPTGAPIVLALSGGGDSLALLHLAKVWADRARRPLLARTVDHGLNPASAAWTRFAAERAGKLGVSHRTLAWTGEKPAHGLPAAARTARHALLAEAARAAGAKVILMGHTADDVLEAEAMRAAGASTPTPRTWSPSPAWPEGRGVFLLRPLLALRRAALRDLLRGLGETWIDDPANDDPRFARTLARRRLAVAPGTAAPPTDARVLWPGLGLVRQGRGGDLTAPRAALSDGAARPAIGALALCASGGTRPPSAAALARLGERLAGAEAFTASLAGARIEADADTVRFCREAGEWARRGLAAQPLPLGESVFDGRFGLSSAAPGAQVTRLGGLAARLACDERRALMTLPAAARGALPVVIGADGAVTAPVLTSGGAVVARPLVLARLRATLGGSFGRSVLVARSGNRGGRLNCRIELVEAGGMNLRNLAIWGAILVAAVLIYSVMQQQTHAGTAPTDIAYSQLLAKIDGGDAKQVNVTGAVIDLTDRSGHEFRAIGPSENDSALQQMLTQHKDVMLTYQRPGPNLLIQFLFQTAPVLLLFGLSIILFRQMQGGARGAMGFGKSKARLLTENKNRITFEDVAGVDEAKEDLTEIVDFLKDPAKFQRLGGKIPKGALMVGPPGTGKTLLGRAVAGEAGVPFFFISGSDFVEMFVGVGASRVRDMFEQAKKNSPCIIFIDEIDAVGRHRGAGLGGGNDEREQTLNQLLVEMDGFDPNEGIIVIASTNRPDVLDPALLRPGRFDRQVVVPNPDIVGRERILRVHMRNVPLAADVDVKVIARGTPGFSGADLANLVNEAALMAARKNRRMVTQPDFEDAKDKVMMGAERKSMVMTDDERRMTAYHEGGHALVVLNVPAADPVHKVTIIPRGRALGMVMQLPERDKLSMSYEQMTSRLAILYGGRVAEELIFGREKVTSGASSDISQATKLARAMVTKWGFSEALGIVEYGENQEEVFLGHSVARNQNVSEDTAKIIDTEVKRLTQAGYSEAKRILTEKIADLHTLAKSLLEYETLSGDEVVAVLKGIAPRRDEPEAKAPPGPRSSVPLAPRPAPVPIPPGAAPEPA